jgi:glutathione S-transferase
MQASSNLETIYVTDSDTPKPPTNTEFPRLYGHLLCPFVEKARMALAARAVKYQGCEVDLGKKTPWHIGYNGGFVPVWETTKGDIIIESKVVMDYIEDAYPDQGYSMLPADPVLRAQNRLGYSLVEALNGAWYALYFKKAYDEAGFKLLHEKLRKIEDFIIANNKNPETSSFV